MTPQRIANDNIRPDLKSLYNSVGKGIADLNIQKWKLSNEQFGHYMQNVTSTSRIVLDTSINIANEMHKICGFSPEQCFMALCMANLQAFHCMMRPLTDDEFEYVAKYAIEHITQAVEERKKRYE